MGKYRSVLFDIDGTLLNDEGYFIQSLQETVGHFLASVPSIEDCRISFSLPSVGALSRLGISADIMEEAVQYYDDLCFRPGAVQPFPGVIEMLNAFRQMEVPLAVFSGRSSYEFQIDPNLQIFLPYFRELIGCGEIPAKPAPDGILYYLDKYALNASELLYVGDSMTDCRAAAGAGVDMALALWGKTGDTSGFPCRYQCKKPADLLQVFAGI